MGLDEKNESSHAHLANPGDVLNLSLEQPELLQGTQPTLEHLRVDVPSSCQDANSCSGSRHARSQRVGGSDGVDKSRSEVLVTIWEVGRGGGSVVGGDGRSDLGRVELVGSSASCAILLRLLLSVLNVSEDGFRGVKSESEGSEVGLNRVRRRGSSRPVEEGKGRRS